MFLVGFRALKKNNKKIIINNINRKKKYFSIINPVSVFLSEALYYIVSKYTNYVHAS